MSSASPRRALHAALAVTLALAVAGGVAVAVAVAAAGGGDTTIAVSPRVLVGAPHDSPADFPGVARARAGQPLPRGYVAVSRDVRITRGGEAAYAALRMACPRGKTWRTGIATGNIGLTVLDRAVSGKRSVLVMATFDARTTAHGQTAAGTIHALCR
jgi:hypothetical protein